MLKQIKKRVLRERGVKCCFCNNYIDPEEKYVEVVTHQIDGTLDRDYFHWQCWKNWFRKSVEDKIKGLTKKSLEVVKNLLGTKDEFQV